MKKISWRKAKGGRSMEHLLEGFVDKKLAFMIEGRLCVTDLREMKSSETWVSPKHYTIVDREDAKRIASDLLNDLNVDEHQANWQAGEDKAMKAAKVIEDAEKFLESLKKK